MRITGLVILIIFYSFYLGKMLAQKRRGIRTDQLARGKQRGRLYYTELLLKLATFTVIPVEVASIFLVSRQPPTAISILGAVLALAGDAVFAAAVITMRDSWRAGIAENEKTALVTDGIYRFSRNPAFLGFDCVYVGILLMFFNLPLMIFSGFAIIMLHLQILREEQHLTALFGDDYLRYKGKVCRYFGRKPEKIQK